MSIVTFLVVLFAFEFFPAEATSMILEQFRFELQLTEISLSECGMANLKSSSRIINGTKTTPHKYPWMAAMFQYNNRYHCQGSVVTRKHILSAAHCFSE
jgi:secreted trypsin-like serine protease